MKTNNTKRLTLKSYWTNINLISACRARSKAFSDGCPGTNKTNILFVPAKNHLSQHWIDQNELISVSIISQLISYNTYPAVVRCVYNSTVFTIAFTNHKVECSIKVSLKSTTLINTTIL